MDTYKVGTVANSTSTMHKLATTPITIDCFETDDYEHSLFIKKKTSLDLDKDSDSWSTDLTVNQCVYFYIDFLESLRLKYLETKDIRYWKELIRWLPEGWLQTRTWTANYAVLRNIIKWRKGHKLTEWQAFIEWCHTLPYSDELLFFEN